MSLLLDILTWVTITLAVAAAAATLLLMPARRAKGRHASRGGAASSEWRTAGMAAALTIEQLFDTLAIRVDGPRAAAESLVIDWQFTDTGTGIRLTLSNGALIPTVNPKTDVKADLTLTLTKPQLLGLLGGGGLDGIELAGDPAALTRLLGVLDEPDPAFPIVTP